MSKTIRAGKLKIYIQLGRVKYSLLGVKIFRKGRLMGAAPHSINSRPPHISETVTAQNLRFHAHLDRVKYTFRI